MMPGRRPGIADIRTMTAVAEVYETDLSRVRPGQNAVIKSPALMDRKSALDYGPLPRGAWTELNGHRIKILGDFYNGAGFISGGSLIVSDDTFSRILGTAISTPNAVLIRFSPNASARTVLGRLQKQLKGDAQVLTRQELKARERHFFMSVNPIGIMFTSGAVIAFLVGAVILYQILSTKVTHHLREYATLKAMGYTGQDLKFVVISRGFLMTAAGFIPADARPGKRGGQEALNQAVFQIPKIVDQIFSDCHGKQT